jgi:hypothetical protein
MPQTPVPVTLEVLTFVPTLLITPEPTPFPTEGASFDSTSTVGTEATSLPVSSDPRLLQTRKKRRYNPSKSFKQIFSVVPHQLN